MKKIGIIGLVVCICLLTGCESHNEGVSYIEEQESLDTKELSKHLTDKRIEEKLTMVKDGTLDVFSMFEDYALWRFSCIWICVLWVFALESCVCGCRKHDFEYFGL